jgi:serine palmitoyltransferase
MESRSFCDYNSCFSNKSISIALIYAERNKYPLMLSKVEELLRCYWWDIAKAVVQTLLVYLVIRFRYRSVKDIIDFPPEVVDKLIKKFDPDELVSSLPDEVLLPDVYNPGLMDLASFDVFDLSNRNKDEIIEVIREYGVGTCGPRGFYGTLDLHLELEKTISEELGVESTIVYSNSFTAVSSIIACFCLHKDIVFYHAHANEAILRGISLSRATTIEYKSLEELEGKLSIFIDPKQKNFVITEGLFRNTGEITDIRRLLELREKHPFRIILDESFSIPLLHKQGVCGLCNADLRSIDILIGSLAHGLCSSGAFSCGSEYTVDYQRLSSLSYCFSASTPAALAKAAILNIKQNFSCERLRELTKLFHDTFSSKEYEIISDPFSPIIVISERKVTRKTKTKESLLSDILEIRKKFISSGIMVGFNHNPWPSIRMCIKSETTESEIKKLVRIWKNW